MAIETNDIWTEKVNRVLEGYDEHLLREVATRLFRPRNQWPAEELIERTLSTLSNVPVLDRRMKDLPPPCRWLLTLIGQSRQPRWPVGNLVEMLVTLEQSDGLEPVLTLLGTGLLYPEYTLPEQNGKVKPHLRLHDLGHWIAQSSVPMVFAVPQVTARAFKESLPTIPDIERPAKPNAAVREADGLEWLLRLAVMWQQVSEAPLRRTIGGDFFKRDLDRLRADPLLATQAHDALTELPDPGLLTAALAVALGLVQEKEGELVAAAFPDSWREGLPAALAAIWSALPSVRGWNGADGWRLSESPGNPYPSAQLLAVSLLAQLADGQWADPDALEQWILARHPFWVNEPKEPEQPAKPRGRPAKTRAEETSAAFGAIARFLLGVAYPLRLLQAAQSDDGKWLVRLSPMGRYVLGLADKPVAAPAYPQTLLVQPTLEILAYRQGLTPELIARLSRLANWKGLGAACTLQLEPSSVYRALESGESFTTLLDALERHGMKATPISVVESLRTWSNKRERITVYPAGALFEFPGPTELNDAIARGLQAIRLTDRLAIVPSESAIDYRHFRLMGTRDYHLPPEKCVDVEDDGVTLSVDLAKSDLLLETELVRFAEPVPGDSAPGRKLYRLTPASIAAARTGGQTLPDLEAWFRRRTGAVLSAAAHLLITGPDSPPATVRRELVVHVPSEEVADGLEQYPATRSLLSGRLGPTTLLISEDNVLALKEKLKELGIALDVT